VYIANAKYCAALECMGSVLWAVCVHVFARMRSFGYQIAKFYMNARMLKISFYTCICYYLLHVCSECADRLPFRSRIHDLKDHGVLLFSFVLFSFFLTNNCSLLYHFLSFVLYCIVLFLSFCIHCVWICGKHAEI